MPSITQPVVLYQYATSPYSKRVSWYLTLRGISFVQCVQPPIMPRADLARLGVKHRRIPILALGRDVYLDTRLILQKLEQVEAAKPPLAAASTPEQRAIQRLLGPYVIETPLFKSFMQTLLASSPKATNDVFAKDRADFINSDSFFTPEQLVTLGPNAIKEVKGAFDLLEATLLSDGRDWLFGTKEPSLADIEAIWPIHWLTLIPTALPKDQVSPTQFPKVFAWLDRFKKAIAEAQAALGEPKTVTGEEAAKLIFGADFHEPEEQVDSNDIIVQRLGFHKGQAVQISPIDTGVNHKDTGKLVGLTDLEVVLEVVGGEKSVRVHAPRHGFAVAPFESSNL